MLEGISQAENLAVIIVSNSRNLCNTEIPLRGNTSRMFVNLIDTYMSFTVVMHVNGRKIFKIKKKTGLNFY